MQKKLTPSDFQVFVQTIKNYRDSSNLDDLFSGLDQIFIVKPNERYLIQSLFPYVKDAHKDQFQLYWDKMKWRGNGDLGIPMCHSFYIFIPIVVINKYCYLFGMLLFKSMFWNFRCILMCDIYLMCAKNSPALTSFHVPFHSVYYVHNYICFGYNSDNHTIGTK